MSLLVDHLWQSTLVCLVLGTCARFSPRAHPEVRLWMWRIAAAKFAVPFALLSALGAWWGMPPHHAEDPPPARLVAWANSLAPGFAPAQTTEIGGHAWLALLTLVPALLLCAWLCRRHLQIEGVRARDLRSLERPDDAVLTDSRAAGVGFVRAVVFSLLAIGIVGSPVIAGAMKDRTARYARLLSNARSLHDARVVMHETAGSHGYRYSVIAGDDGVLIRNANIQDLVAMVYGVDSWIVTTNQFQESELGQAWIYSPRYDVRIVGHVAAPERFDTYALRVPMTKLLSTRFGLEIYLNSKCQPPCGRWGSLAPAEASD